MKKIMLTVISICIMLSTQSAFAGAGIPVTILGSHSHEEAYGGLKWHIGGKSSTPELVIGYRKTNTDYNFYESSEGGLPLPLTEEDNRFSPVNVDGHDFSLTIDLTGFSIKEVRAKYFEGHGANKRASQEEASLGWNFEQGGFLGLGIKMQHLNIGVDYFMSQPKGESLDAYWMIDSVDKATIKFDNYSLSCPPNFEEIGLPNEIYCESPAELEQNGLIFN
jgi:hypothetical protein